METGINPIDTQEFTDIPISIDGVVVGVLLREMTEPNWIKVSLRSRNGFDVNTVANKFGGGGHKYAAGCEIQGTITEVQRLILDELEKALSLKSSEICFELLGKTVDTIASTIMQTKIWMK